MISLKLIAPLALAALVATPLAQREADTVVLVVRHAEKSAPSGDVPLSAAGESRAQALVAIGREAGVSAVITTQFQRTRQTAAPLATALGITPEVIDVKGGVAEHVAGIAQAIKTRHAGRTVLVVGHSNTVPAIVTALGGPKLPTSATTSTTISSPSSSRPTARRAWCTPDTAHRRPSARPARQ